VRARDPLDRDARIGREAELKKPQLAYAAAAPGVSSLALVVRGSGIDKTAPCGQLIAHAVIQLGQALPGNCCEARTPVVWYRICLSCKHCDARGETRDG
jgi:hypothetical protein